MKYYLLFSYLHQLTGQASLDDIILERLVMHCTYFHYLLSEDEVTYYEGV